MNSIVPNTMLYCNSSIINIDIIKHLKNKKSCGHDGIPVCIIKLLNNMISPILSYIFNQCIISSKYPESLKVAKVIPLFKSGDRQNPGNYRPISLLPIINKIFEKCIHRRLNNYCMSIHWYVYITGKDLIYIIY